MRKTHSRSFASAAGAPIALDGPIADGLHVSLGWPEASEFDWITALRNRPAVRRCFLDPRPLDTIANRAWIAHEMRRPREGLLSIRIGAQRVFCGTIGWSGYDPHERTFEIGRLMVDTVVARLHRAALPAGYPGIAVDASRALLRYAFETMELAFVSSVLLCGLALPRRVNMLAGGVVAGEAERTRADGTRVRVTTFILTRERWLVLDGPPTDAVRAPAVA